LKDVKDIRLRIDILHGQSRILAEILSKALSQNNNLAVKDYSTRLVSVRAKIKN
jgi:hypothetical protein